MDKDPCETCILLAMCINKKPSGILINCSLVEDYIISQTIKPVGDVSYFKHYSRTLNKQFSLIYKTGESTLWVLDKDCRHASGVVYRSVYRSVSTESKRKWL